MGNSKVILLIEDDIDHADLFGFALDKIKIPSDIKHSIDGEKAIEYLANISKDNPEPDVIFLDLQLPKFDGFEVLEKIKEMSLTHIPIVVLTSSSAPKDINKCKVYGIFEYITKPIELDALLAIMLRFGFKQR